MSETTFNMVFTSCVGAIIALIIFLYFFKDSKTAYTWGIFFSVATIVFQIMLRLFVNGDVATFSQNTFIHNIIWASVAIWLLAAIMKGDLTLSFSGIEIPLFIFAGLCAYSLTVGVQKQPAALYSFAYISLVLLTVFLTNFSGGNRYIYGLLYSVVFTLAVYALIQYLWLFDIAREEFRQNPNLENLPPELIKEFTWRINTDQVFATFVLSNSFAGFLALTLPIVLGSFIDLMKNFKDKISYVAFFLKVALLLLSIYALIKTQSKGGGGATVAPLFIFIAYYVWHISPFWKKVVKMVTVTGLVIVAILFIMGIPENKFTKIGSAQFRVTYWGSAINAGKHNPVFGIGLGNYNDYHTIYKDDRQNEVTKVHDDYLQIFAEMGVTGLAAFAILWGTLFYLCSQELFILLTPMLFVILWWTLFYAKIGWQWLAIGIVLFVPLWLTLFYYKVIRSKRNVDLAVESAQHGGNRGSPNQAVKDNVSYSNGEKSPTFIDMRLVKWVVILLVFAAFYVAYYLTDSFNDLNLKEPLTIPGTNSQFPVLGVILGIAFTIYYLLTYKSDIAISNRDTSYTRVGAAAGIVAFLLHIVVDFDFYVLGVSETVFIMLAFNIMLLGSGSAKKFTIKRPILIPLFILILGCFAFIGLKVIPRSFKYDRLTKDALAQFRQSFDNMIDPKTRQVVKQTLNRDRVKLALDTYAQAAKEFPYDIRPFTESAGINYRLWQQASGDENVAECERLMPVILGNIDKALEVRPKNFQLRYQKADFVYDFYKFYQKHGDTQKAQKFFNDALYYYRESEKYYPTRAPIRFRMGKILEEAGKRDEAAKEYKEAIRLNKKAEYSDLDRLTIFEFLRDVVTYGKLAQGMGLADDAKDAFQTALRLDDRVKKKNYAERTNYPTLAKEDLRYIKNNLKTTDEESEYIEKRLNGIEESEKKAAPPTH